MQITFLDASTLHRDDLDFSPFEKFGPLTFHDTTTPLQLPDHAAGADVLVTNKVPLTAENIAQLPDLKLVLIAATGFNHIDLAATAARGIPVCNVAGYSTAAVAQHAFALLLNLVTRAHRFDAEIQSWSQSPIFSSLDYPVVELAGKTMGLVGLGDTGKAVARVAEALGMSVQALAREGASPSEYPRLQREEFFATSDVISLHAPLNDETAKLINSETLGLMKASAYLINTGRGGLVDEPALAKALREDKLAGAGLDVLSVEPPTPNNPLLAADLRAKNLVLTPHTAWSALEARQRLLAGLLANLEAYLSGETTNQVN
ncbi:D-2-hydroxyacid dehydrogenase [Roseibacillus ishigakijimensis]|uniref:D-2-hydroxyacid dehydrogenase n=1 Tax=Roseibacillus ishigakijimensis TaxID=454146 RepID=A0A934VL60_9BACT|nr:D-2-hydroxyacid dehydrogenase [Roseibacillus ishigakijimensis]MBK1832786.1 D-2-hydroxyacid dehydrogenase [Roseibacillus ishigakijimensis]